MPPLAMKANILRERYEFHKRKQGPDEPLQAFVDEMCRLAESCNFGDQMESLVRDHIVFGLKDKDVCLSIIDQGGDPSINEIMSLCSVFDEVVPASGSQMYIKQEMYVKEESEQQQMADEILGGKEADDVQDIDEILIENGLSFEFEADDAKDILAGNEENDKTDDDIIAEYLDLKSVDEIKGIIDEITSQFTATEPVVEPSLYEDDTVRVETSEPAVTEKRTRKKREIKPESFGCKKCDKTFARKWDLNYHMSSHDEERRFKCPKCSRTFKTERYLNNHLRLSHAAFESLPCPHCPKILGRQSTLKKHVEAKHPESIDGYQKRDYECYVCHKVFKSEPALRKHVYGHFYTNNLLCSRCGKYCCSEAVLKRHLMSHEPNTANRPFKCTHCKKTFGGASALREHVATHTQEKSYVCEECGKQFRASSNLYQHRLIHSEIKRHQCHLCEYKCHTAGNLRKHMTKHLKR